MQIEKETKAARRRRLLGPLAEVLRNEVLREHEVIGAELHGTRSCEECLDDPRWATLESLDLRWRNAPWLVGRSGAFFNSRASLKTVEGLSAKLVPEVPCPRIVQLSVARLSLTRIAESFPALRSLDLDEPREEANVFWCHPLVRALKNVTIRSKAGWRLNWAGGVLRVETVGWPIEDVSSWIAEGPALTAIELGAQVEVTQWIVGELTTVIAAAQRRGAVDVPDLRHRCEHCGAPSDWDAPARERPLLGWWEDERALEQEDEPGASGGDRAFA